jgi:chaperonin GroEL
VIRCALENASSVAKIFLLADVVVTDIPEKAGAPAPDVNAE